MGIITHATVRNVVELINKRIDDGDEELVKHSKTLLGPRKRGSTTEKGLEDIDGDTPIEMASNAGGIGIYIGYSNELGGKLGAIGLGPAIAKGLVVSQREGEHGPELFVDRSIDEIELADTPVFTVIIGEHNGLRTVFTWHPGYALNPFDGKTMNKDTAVKLHNG